MRPELADLMAGMREVRRLQAQGWDLDLEPGETTALGRAVLGPPSPDDGQDQIPTSDQVQVLNHIRAEQDQQLALIRARAGGCSGCFIGTRHAPCDRDQRPSVTGNRYARDPAAGSIDGLDAEQGRSAEREQHRIADRNVRNEKNDPSDEEWS
jgi:hypothetical protein